MAANSASAAKTGVMAAIPRASAAYGTTTVPASTNSGWGNRRSRCHSRQVSASRPMPLTAYGRDVPDLHGVPLDHDVAGQPEVEGVEGARRCR